jgi:hypothetical protein
LSKAAPATFGGGGDAPATAAAFKDVEPQEKGLVLR